MGIPTFFRSILQKNKNIIDAKRLIIDAISDSTMVSLTNGLSDYDKPEIKIKVIENAIERLKYGQGLGERKTLYA
jgi:hypothetical protein